MARKLAIEWIKTAYYDLENIRYIIDIDYLTHIIAFHSQQAIEKSFKAILAFNNKKIPKKHDLFALHEIVKSDIGSIDTNLLFRINELYIDSRYLGDIGLLPYGKPTLEDAKEFYEFSNGVFNKVCEILGVDRNEFIRQ